MALFLERGYDCTTVGEIAARARLTERTFFRYFTDKREVLFSGAKDLPELVTGAMVAAPAEMSPLDVVAAGLAASSTMLEALRPFAKKRQTLIEAHAELYERELIKLAELAAGIAETLQKRGVDADTAVLLGESGIALFKSALLRWLAATTQEDLAHYLRAVLEDLRRVASVPPPRSGRCAK